MKLIKITSLALLAGFLIAGTGCKRNIDEFGIINQNPSLAPDLNTRGLLTNAISGMGNEAWSVTGGLYAQLYSETQYTEASRYTRLRVDFGGYYSGVLYDLLNIIKYNENPETAPKALANGSNANQIAIARILKAWWYLRVTDAWGDVPYSQALNAKGDIPYDDQESIYDDLFVELREAVAQFDSDEPFKGDILFYGDNDGWKRFANSLRMIMAIRLAAVNATKGKAEFIDAMSNSAGYMTDNSENAMLEYPGGTYSSVFYTYYNLTQRSDYAISATVTDHMAPGGIVRDNRIYAWGSSTKGFPYGYERDDAITWTNSGNSDWARIMSDDLRTPSQPMPILTASQVTLARAEAAQRGWTLEDDAQLYRDGIQLNWEQWGVYDAVDFTAYMLQPDIIYAGELEKIIRQRWLASFPDGQEAWNIWRSTKLPVLDPAPGTGLEIPLRFAISQNHFDLNLANTNVIAQKYTVGGEADSQYGRPWWVMP